MKKENTMAENALPTGWRTTTLGEVVELVSEKISCNNVDIKKYISTENMLPYKGGVKLAATIPSNGNCSSFEIGDVLFSNIRTYFQKVWLASFKGGSSNDVIIFRPKIKDELNKDYLYYMICNDRFIDYTVLTAKGTKMPRGDKDAIKQYSLFLPSLNEQKAIAKVLSSFDDKIELLQEQNKTLEETAQTIFKEWFGKYQVGDKLPEGWIVYALDDIIKIVNGYSYKGKELKEDSENALVTLKNFDRTGGFQSRGFKPFEGVPKTSQEVKIGDLVIAHTDLTQDAEVLGNPAFIFDNSGFKKMYITMDLVKVDIKIKEFTNAFMYYLMKTKRFKAHCKGYSNGTTVLHLAKNAVPEYKIVLTKDLDLIIKFSELADNSTNKIAYNISQIQSLKKIRDELLPKLMKGSIRVQN
ncbi:MAG: restriction endonuclease subunit S [Marinifilaceae bacterium]